MFLNYDISPLKAQKNLDQDLSAPVETQYSNSEPELQQRIQQQKAYYAAYVKKVNSAAKVGSGEQNRGAFEEKAPVKGIVDEHTEQLFRIAINPYIPDFILQGNYVVNGSSPDKQYSAYIYPDDWETIGDIYIKDSVKSRWIRLQLDQEYRVKMWNTFAPQGKYTPKKKLLWLDNNEFITIIGFAHGTVSKGGELVKVNHVTGEAEILYPAYQYLNQEVVDFEQREAELLFHININDINGFCLEKKEVRIPLNNLVPMPKDN